MDKKFIIAGNWKMNKTIEESISFFNTLHKNLTFNDSVEVLIFPPAIALSALTSVAGKIQLGAQNFHDADSGAYTGEISQKMLSGLATYLLAGHSERRQIFGESDELINRKVQTALNNGFIPVLCIGETLAERERGDTFNIVQSQLEVALKDIQELSYERLVIAYEPVWAIGTGKTATPEQAQEVHEFIRKFLSGKTQSAARVPILYGGSVKPENSYDLLSQNDINGALIGGASLKPDQFFDIISNSYKLI